jgi:hypothetical protein
VPFPERSKIPEGRHLGNGSNCYQPDIRIDGADRYPPTFYRKDDTVSYAYGVIAMLALV